MLKSLTHYKRLSTASGIRHYQVSHFHDFLNEPLFINLFKFIHSMKNAQ